jgi:uncharacterized RDD family membrane protein YckC
MSTNSAASLQGHYAGFVSRLLGIAIDLGIIGTITVVVSWISLSMLQYIGIDIRECPPLDAGLGGGALMCVVIQWTGIAVGLSFPSIYTLFFWTTTGQTPGKAVMGLRVVRLDGRPMTLWTGIVRLAGFSVSLASAGLGFLLALADNRRQALHDKFAGTCVIYSWDAHADPYLKTLFPRLFDR